MLGERYGWTPPHEGYAPDLLERQPWLKKHQGGRSVTVLEIIHGVLKNKRMKSRAKEIYFGLSGISSGANSDLSNATRVSFQMFAHSGFHPLMEKGEGTSANLAVIGRGEVDDLQNDRIYLEVRQFLAPHYEQVVVTLKKHHDFVNAVADRLMQAPVIDQQEMTQIAIQFDLVINPSHGVQPSAIS